MLFRITLVLISLLIITRPSQADTIYLKNGEQVEGEVVSQNPESINVATEAGPTIQYYRHEIDHTEPTKTYLSEKYAFKIIQPNTWEVTEGDLYDTHVIEYTIENPAVIARKEEARLWLETMLKNPKRIVQFNQDPFTSKLIYDNPTIGVDTIDIRKSPKTSPMDYAKIIIEASRQNEDIEFSVTEEPKEFAAKDGKVFVRVAWRIKAIKPTPWPYYTAGSTYEEIRCYYKATDEQIISLFAYSLSSDFPLLTKKFDRIRKSFKLY